MASAEFKKQYETATNPKQLVDVRTAEEFQAGTLSEAVNIDCKKDNFESELQKLDKNNKLFIFCQRGGRSADAHKIALKAGFQQVIELEGGYEAWQKAKQ